MAFDIFNLIRHNWNSQLRDDGMCLTLALHFQYLITASELSTCLKCFQTISSIRTSVRAIKVRKVNSFRNQFLIHWIGWNLFLTVRGLFFVCVCVCCFCTLAFQYDSFICTIANDSEKENDCGTWKMSMSID